MPDKWKEARDLYLHALIWRSQLIIIVIAANVVAVHIACKL